MQGFTATLLRDDPWFAGGSIAESEPLTWSWLQLSAALPPPVGVSGAI
jgi:hypothetical protein